MVIISGTVENLFCYEILDTIAGNYEIEVFSVSPSGLRSIGSAKLVTGGGNFFVANGKTATPQNVSGVSLLPIDQSSAILSWNRATEFDVAGGKL